MQLVKIGKRKCCICKKIKDLNLENFYNCSIKGQCGFRSSCKDCDKKRFLKNVKNFEDYNAKAYILKTLGKKCNHCGIKSNIKGFFDIDHIEPRIIHTKKEPRNTKKGEIKNLQVLCPNCHRIKTIKDRKKFKWGRNKIK
jgi:hypothetical protein